ncbi:MAG: class I SAM-dependent methyltransferase [Spirulinaceae cyanobacterium]
MGFYSKVVFPRLLDVVMSDQELATYRQELLADVRGKVLEIGFGTGLNLPYYPDNIEKITTIDANSGMNKLAQKRIQASSLKVEHRVLNGESLPMENNSFDSVVSTWTLCSIVNIDKALKEIYRVLKPGGNFFFIEHGLSNKEEVQVWQNRLNPLQKIIADGCNLNRNIKLSVEKHFDKVQVEEFLEKNSPEFAGYTYKGVATKK